MNLPEAIFGTAVLAFFAFLCWVFHSDWPLAFLVLVCFMAFA